MLRYSLRLWLAVLVIGVVILGSFLPYSLSSADSYDVQASVPYPAPTQKAVFESDLADTTVHDAAQTLTGTCQLMNPATVVSIWRGATSIGSANCISGRFSVQVMLVPGNNELIARTANASSLYGPDSQQLTITLVLPAVVTPPASTASDNKPSSPAELAQATNAGAVTELQAVSTQPFSVIASDNAAVHVQIVVSGGSSPYDINLNWGDGSTEAHSVPNEGTYTYDHTYTKPTNYTVRARIRDSVGAYTVLNYAVVSYKPAPNTASPITTAPGTPAKPTSSSWLPIAFGTLIVGGLAFSSLGYRLGVRNTNRSHPKVTKNKRKKS